MTNTEENLRKRVESISYELTKALLEADRWRKLLEKAVSKSCSHCADSVQPGRAALTAREENRPWKVQ